MTQTAHPNVLSRFFQGIIKLATDLMPKEKERAVRMWDIVSFVQRQLDEMGTTNEYGDKIPSGYVMDAYIDNAGTFAIVTRSDGKLYKIPVFIDEQSQMSLGEEAEVFMEFTPVSRSIFIKRQLDEDGKPIPDTPVRWFAMPACTAFLNRSGEIDSRQLFDSFVEYAERANDFPELDFYHLGERLVLGKADILFRDDVNFCASGVFDDSDIARAAIKSLEDKGDYWGLSIAYLPTKEPEKIRSTEGVEIPVFNDGICRFISLLPEDTAASILTSISTKERSMNEAQKKALKELTGDDSALFEAIEAQLKENNRAAAQPGVIVRQTAPAVAKATEKPAVQTPAPAAPVKRESDFAEFLKSDDFKNTVTAIFTEIRAAEAKGEDDEEGEGDGDEVEVSEPVAEARTKESLESKVDALLAQMEALGKSREATLQEVLDDLPAKVAKARIVRPRAQFVPDDLTTEARRSVPLAEIANRTLEKIEAG